MEKKEIMNKIYNGSTIDCEKEEYENGLRKMIQDVAGEFVDHNDGIRAQIALMEVKRLDDKFNFNPVK